MDENESLGAGILGLALAITIVTGGFALIVLIPLWIYWYYSSPEERKKRQRKKEQCEEALRIKQLQEKEEEKLKFKKYQELRKSIEQMPKYKKWREDVFQKNGRECEVCGEKENLEIHHRTSFYSIIKTYDIDDVYKAFECNALWDIDNGSVICKFCHEKTQSHQYRNNNLIN